MRWWGWGDPGPPAGAARARARLSRARPSASRERPRPPVALEQRALAPASLGEARARGAARDRRRRGRARRPRANASLHAAGKGYPDLVRLRAGEPEGAPDAVVLPGGHEQVRALLELCARASLAVVPFGGGTSVVGGVAPLRGEHAGVVALDMRRMGERARARPRVAHGHACRPACALRRSSATWRARAHARALPAVLRVRLARRLRGDALGRTGLERLRRDRADGARPARSRRRRGEIELPAIPASAAGPGAAPAAGRLGGHAGGDQRALAARARGAARARLRGRLLRGLRRRRGGAARARPGARACPTWRGCPTSRRRACRSRSPARVA